MWIYALDLISFNIGGIDIKLYNSPRHEWRCFTLTNEHRWCRSACRVRFSALVSWYSLQFRPTILASVNAAMLRAGPPIPQPTSCKQAWHTLIVCNESVIKHTMTEVDGVLETIYFHLKKNWWSLTVWAIHYEQRHFGQPIEAEK